MPVNLFYVTESAHSTPLYLISQIQWKEGMDSLTSAERNCLAVRQFMGKSGEYCLIYNSDGLIEKVYMGSGNGNQGQALANAALLLPAGTYTLNDTLDKDAAVSWALAQYRFVGYKKQEDVLLRRLVTPVDLLQDIVILAQAVFVVRDLINTPANDMGPQQMAEVMEQLAHTHHAQFKQWIGDELLKGNFPAIHTVGRASEAAPRLLSLTWGNKKHPLITLVGKGVSFDSGGLDIKPSSAMRLMKKDMGGAAHAIGIAQWIMARELPVRLHLLVPAVENAIGPNAFRPGDVITMRNGLTVEVDNTDAEGRLILADALAKACEEKPDLLIDFATLTGAARVALGTEVAALFSNNDALVTEVIAASHKAAESVWRLPLHAPYDDLLKSSVADLANCSVSPYGGAITAALFLQRFITPSTPWLHFDVMAWNVSSKPGKPEGGEALGLRTIVAYLNQVYG